MKRYWLMFLLLAAACAKLPPKLPSPLQIEAIRIPWENAFPSDVAVDARGRVWFTDRMTHVIGRYDPDSREFASFPTPTPKSAPYGLITAPDGVLWFAESMVGRLGRVDVGTGAIREVPLPGVARGGPHLLAYSGRRIWFTMRESRQWGWYDPATGESALHPVAVLTLDSVVRPAKPYSIAPAPDGGVWIGTYDGPYLLRARPDADTLEQHVLARELPPVSGLPSRLANAPDSVRERLSRMPRYDAVGARRSTADARGTLWIADFVRGRVIRYSEAADSFTTYPSLAPTAAPYGIGIDPWARIWYHEMVSHNLVVLDPRTDERISIPVRQHNAAIRHIAFDRERKRVWLPISDAGVLGVVQLR